MTNNRKTINHALFALIMVLAMFAGALTPSGDGTSPPEARASEVVTGVAPFADANFEGVATLISTSVPDLSQFGSGWANRISALKVLGGIAIAAYSGTNYTGTCEPFVGEDPWLGNNRIGNDTIESIKLFATCSQDPVTDAVITDMTVVAGESAQTYCPSDYVQKDQDLNDGVGGDYIYLCLKVGQKSGDVSNGNFVSRLEVIVSLRPASDSSCDAHFIGVDLNKGAGGTFVYLCYWKAGQNNGDQGVTTATGTFRDIAFATDDNPFLSDEAILSKCRNNFRDVVVGNVGTDSVQRVQGQGTAGNLNDSAFPPTANIWMCALTYNSPLAGPPDTTPPTVSASATADGTPYVPGTWTNQDVIVTFTCVDHANGSGVASVTSPITVSTEGADQSVAGICADVAGNVAHASFSGINIDKTAPATIRSKRTPDTGNGWNNTDVDISWFCLDTGSGPVTSTLKQRVSDEGENQSATATCEDLAGNTSTDIQRFIHIDKTAPTISFVKQRPEANANGWNNTSVELEWSCTDTLSGALDAMTFRTVSSEGANLAATGLCEDLAGNRATAEQSGINIDLIAPQISFVSRTPANSHGWSNEDVTVTWNCTDSLSGAADTPVSQTLSAEGANQTATGTCEDLAGNSVTATEPGINIDKTAPVVEFLAHPAFFMVDQTVEIGCDATDALSGIDTDCEGVDQPAYLFGLGEHTVSTSATDRAGNVASTSTSFEVRVDAESQSALHDRWVSNPGVRESLDEMVQSIADAPNENAKRGKLQAYENLLAAQTGKSVDAEHAAILVELAEGL